MEKEGERAGEKNGEGVREGERKGGKKRMWRRGRKTHYMTVHVALQYTYTLIQCYQHNF